ncbi:PulJ/GspJ family protein [Jeotgalibacillus haloalkalitolerans]|uniref:Type II secretion system protein n=1 Tax=Jeotgalibacillus haloalkalitolerans TaxID=3104292 RepID=A0ABU5KJ28_9BACL|nr:type II secretion system protein [Jeotgalibacillus sp. HH7-29]MDZ5710730.1 type II secretion system protein [Jeotgalibacillus sp. HH7-29]
MGNERGFTLTELLAVLALISLISVFAIGIVTQADSSADQQQEESLSTRKVTFALQSITTDIRQHPKDIEVQTASLIIQTDGEPIIYSFDDGTQELLRNGRSILNKVADFTPDLDGDTLNVLITDTSAKKWETQIVLRKGTDL